MPPAAIDGVDERGAGKPVGTVAKLLNAMFNDDCQVLVPTKMHGLYAAQFFEGLIAPGLRPAVAVQTGQESIAWIAMHVDSTAKCGLRKYCFYLRTGPVFAPLAQKLELSVAEQLQTRQVDRSGIIRGVVDMVGSRAQLGYFSGRSRFELAIFQDGEID